MSIRLLGGTPASACFNTGPYLCCHNIPPPPYLVCARYCGRVNALHHLQRLLGGQLGLVRYWLAVALHRRLIRFSIMYHPWNGWPPTLGSYCHLHRDIVVHDLTLTCPLIWSPPYCWPAWWKFYSQVWGPCMGHCMFAAAGGSERCVVWTHGWPWLGLVAQIPWLPHVEMRESVWGPAFCPVCSEQLGRIRPWCWVPNKVSRDHDCWSVHTHSWAAS